MYIHCDLLCLGYWASLIPVTICDRSLLGLTCDGVVLESCWSKREHRPWGQSGPFNSLGLKQSCPPWGIYPQSKFCGLPLSAPAPRRTKDANMLPHSGTHTNDRITDVSIQLPYPHDARATNWFEAYSRSKMAARSYLVMNRNIWKGIVSLTPWGLLLYAELASHIVKEEPVMYRRARNQFHHFTLFECFPNLTLKHASLCST